MNVAWESEFSERMRSFEAHALPDGVSISLKIRVASGCFHREHSPRAYALIDQHLASIPRRDGSFEYLEHESGPEILVSLVLATAGLGLAKSVIDLIVAIIQARRTGVENGDSPSDPVDLIVRRYDASGTLREEIVLRADHAQPVERSEIEARLSAALERIADEGASEQRPGQSE